MTFVELYQVENIAEIESMTELELQIFSSYTLAQQILYL